jgi:hypothetical protein
MLTIDEVVGVQCLVKKYLNAQANVGESVREHSTVVVQYMGRGE